MYNFIKVMKLGTKPNKVEKGGQILMYVFQNRILSPFFILIKTFILFYLINKKCTHPFYCDCDFLVYFDWHACDWSWFRLWIEK